MKTILLLRQQDEHFPHGYGNSYVGVDSDHPWFGKAWNEIDVDVHGGVTWAKDHVPNQKPDGLWWLGFVTGHWGDNIQTWSPEQCEAELANFEQLAQLAYDKV